MKKLFFAALIAGSLFACNNNSTSDAIENKKDSTIDAIEDRTDSTQHQIQENADSAKARLERASDAAKQDVKDNAKKLDSSIKK